MSLGVAIPDAGSGLTRNPLGVVQVGFKGWDLGKTTADAEFSSDEDIKDILFQQDGTKPSDHVRTGQEYLVKVTFGEIKTRLISLLLQGFNPAVDTSVESVAIARSVYQSMRDTFAGVLKVAACSGEGVPSDDPEDILHFYEAIPIIDGAAINWGADTQRNLAVSFRIKFHPFTALESTTYAGGFGYIGDPTDVDVPAIVWPVVGAPSIVSVEVTSTTQLKVTFDRAVNLTGTYADFQVVGAAGFAVASASTGGGTTQVTFTFAAGTFAGDGTGIFFSEDGAVTSVAGAVPSAEPFNVNIAWDN